MKIKDIIVESEEQKAPPASDPSGALAIETKSAMMNATTFPAQNMSTGSAYMNYRFGIALAGAPDYPTKADNWIGGDPLISTYTEVEKKMVDAAAQMVGSGHGQNWSGKRSEEIPGTGKTSPVAKPKKNKYGV